MSKVQQLWIELERAQFRVEEGESVLERVSVVPWQSEDALVQAAWNALTSPVNLAGLEEWGRHTDMNPTARRYTDKAIGVCRERKELEQEDEPELSG